MDVGGCDSAKLTGKIVLPKGGVETWSMIGPANGVMVILQMEAQEHQMQEVKG